jgi:hypothetical protein
VLVAQASIREVNWAGQSVDVALTRHELEKSPEYDRQYSPSSDAETTGREIELRRTS